MLKKKYYDGFIVHDILNKHLDDGHKILELLTAFADAHGVDAVPVIRCKDCKHSEPWYRDRRRCFLWNENGIDVFDDGYCNYGKIKAERKEE